MRTPLRFREAWARGAGEDPGASFELVDRRLHEDRLDGAPREAPRGPVRVLTPRSIVAAIAAGYAPAR